MKYLLLLPIIATLQSCALNPEAMKRSSSSATDERLIEVAKETATGEIWNAKRTAAVNEISNRRLLNPIDLNHVKNGTVYIGMKADVALMSWGYPNDKNTTATSNGSREQWVYGRYGSVQKTRYIYTRNGKVTAIQN